MELGNWLGALNGHCVPQRTIFSHCWGVHPSAQLFKSHINGTCGSSPGASHAATFRELNASLKPSPRTLDLYQTPPTLGIHHQGTMAPRHTSAAPQPRPWLPLSHPPCCSLHEEHTSPPTRPGSRVPPPEALLGLSAICSTRMRYGSPTMHLPQGPRISEIRPGLSRLLAQAKHTIVAQ